MDTVDFDRIEEFEDEPVLFLKKVMGLASLIQSARYVTFFTGAEIVKAPKLTTAALWVAPILGAIIGGFVYKTVFKEAKLLEV